MIGTKHIVTQTNNVQYFASGKGIPGESIQGTYKRSKKIDQYACILFYQERARTLVYASRARENAKPMTVNNINV